MSVVTKIVLGYGPVGAVDSGSAFHSRVCWLNFHLEPACPRETIKMRSIINNKIYITNSLTYFSATKNILDWNPFKYWRTKMWYFEFPLNIRQ